jgi:hypothetical protein
MRAYLRHVDRARRQLTIALTRMASDIDSQDMARIHRWPRMVVPSIRKAERSYAERATNVAAFATMLGMHPPRWLHTMDRWD